MRHLELPVVRLDNEDDIKSECDIVIKDEDLEDLDIKDEFIGLGAFDEALQSDVDFHTYDKKDLVGVQPIAEGKYNDVIVINKHIIFITIFNNTLIKKS